MNPIVLQSVEGFGFASILPQTTDGLALATLLPQTADGLAMASLLPQTADGLAIASIMPKAVDGLAVATLVPKSSKGLGWGTCVAVPSVQEIVRNDSHSMPERYIQVPKNRASLGSDFFPASSEIPIINFSLLANGDDTELKKLDTACKEWGFFQLTNHEIAEKVLHDTKEAVAAFFELPLDEKKKYSMAANIEGYGQGVVVSDDKLKSDWCDALVLMTHPPKNRKLNLWPATLIPGFKEAVEKYTAETQKIAEEILAKLSLLMGMDKDGLKMLHGEMRQSMKMNYYPNCSRPDLVLGISPHSDSSTITLLLQGDDEINGLQIKHKDSWIPVKPIPNAIIINIGEVAEIFSNGMYKSIEHRAVTHEKAARISIATFVIPSEEAEIGPVESIVNENQPRIYRNIKYIDYLGSNLKEKLNGNDHTRFLKPEK